MHFHVIYALTKEYCEWLCNCMRCSGQVLHLVCHQHTKQSSTFSSSDHFFPFFSSPLSVVFSAFNFLFLCRGCYFFASGWLSIPFLAIFLFASCYFFSFYSFFLFNCPSHLCYRLICFNIVFGFSSYFFLVHLRENNCWKCFYFSVAVTGRQS